MLRRFSNKWIREIYELASNAKAWLHRGLPWTFHMFDKEKGLGRVAAALAGLLLGDH